MTYDLKRSEDRATEPGDTHGLMGIPDSGAPYTFSWADLKQWAAAEGVLELASSTDNSIMDSLLLTERAGGVSARDKFYVSGGEAGGLRGKLIRRNSTALPNGINQATFRTNFATYWETILGGSGGTVTTRDPVSGDGSGGDPVTLEDKSLSGRYLTDKAIVTDKIGDKAVGTAQLADEVSRPIAKIEDLKRVTADLHHVSKTSQGWNDVNGDGSEGGVGAVASGSLANAQAASYSAPSITGQTTFGVIRIPAAAAPSKYRIEILGITSLVSSLRFLGSDATWRYYELAVRMTADETLLLQIGTHDIQYSQYDGLLGAKPLAQAVPDGGTQDQVLAKKSAADRDTEWVDQSGDQFTSGEVDEIHRVLGAVALDTDGTWSDVSDADVCGWAHSNGIPTLNQAKALTYTATELTIPDAQEVVTRIPVIPGGSHRFRGVWSEVGSSGTGNYLLSGNGALLIGVDGGYEYWIKEFVGNSQGFAVKMQQNSDADTWLGDLTKRAVYDALKTIIQGAGATASDTDETVTITGGGGALSLTLVGTDTSVGASFANFPKAGGGNITRADLSDTFLVDLMYTRSPNSDLSMSGLVVKSDLDGTTEKRFQVQGAGGDFVTFQFSAAGDTGVLQAKDDSGSTSSLEIRIFNVESGEKGEKGDKGG